MLLLAYGSALLFDLCMPVYMCTRRARSILKEDSWYVCNRVSVSSAAAPLFFHLRAGITRTPVWPAWRWVTGLNSSNSSSSLTECLYLSTPNNSRNNSNIDISQDSSRIIRTSTRYIRRVPCSNSSSRSRSSTVAFRETPEMVVADAIRTDLETYRSCRCTPSKEPRVGEQCPIVLTRPIFPRSGNRVMPHTCSLCKENKLQSALS